MLLRISDPRALSPLGRAPPAALTFGRGQGDLMGLEPADRLRALRESVRTGTPVRLHIADGEVVVARILEQGPQEVVYTPVTSSRPEKYALCDATGFAVPLEAIRKAALLGPSRGSSRGGRSRKDRSRA
jgi:hypothetical protein